jgi:hypothetical protein
MKSLSRYLIVVLSVSFLAISQSLWAGECCAKAVEAAKKGEACPKCLDHACCKAAAKGAKGAKDCTKCAGHSEEKSHKGEKSKGEKSDKGESTEEDEGDKE